MHHPVFTRITLLVSMALIVLSTTVTVYGQENKVTLTNTTCPVTAGEAVDPDEYVEYQGQRVYFCCNRCLKRFQANPARYAESLARVMPVSTAESGNIDSGTPLSKKGSASVGEQHEHHSEASSAGRGKNASSPVPAEKDNNTTGATPRAGAGGDAFLGEDHDHSDHDAGDSGSFLDRFLGWVGKFHPPTTHFPIGLLTAAAVAEFLFIKTKRPLFDNAAQFCVWLGAGGALAAVMLGWFFAGFRLVDDNWIMTTHRWMGTSVALLSLIVVWLSTVSHREGNAKRLPAYRAALFLTVSLVGATGFLGGAMIYGINHYAW